MQLQPPVAHVLFLAASSTMGAQQVKCDYLTALVRFAHSWIHIRVIYLYELSGELSFLLLHLAHDGKVCHQPRMTSLCLAVSLAILRVPAAGLAGGGGAAGEARSKLCAPGCCAASCSFCQWKPLSLAHVARACMHA